VRVSEYGATPISTTKAPFNLIIAGPDAQVLDNLAQQAMQRLQQVPGLTDLRRSWHMDKLQQNIVIDPEVARLFGTSPAALGETVRNAVQGGIASNMRLDQFLDIPIRVRYAKEDTSVRTDLDEIYIPIHPQEMRNRKGNIHGHLHSTVVKDQYGHVDNKYRCVSMEHIQYTPMNFQDIKAEFNLEAK
jgi:multidrug efflux pump subunit AcrB